MDELTPAALWLRVSTSTQETDNQVPDLLRFAAAHRLDPVRTFEVSDSAWSSGPAYKRTLAGALAGAWEGHYQVLAVWALDRICREGAEEALRLVRVFRERGCTILSVQEPWLNGSPEIQDVLIAFAGWQAKIESDRKSERIRAGLERRRAAGLPVGRQPGAGDKKQRRRSGYVARWERERSAAK